MRDILLWFKSFNVASEHEALVSQAVQVLDDFVHHVVHVLLMILDESFN